MSSTTSRLIFVIILCTQTHAKANCPSHCRCNYEDTSYCRLTNTNVNLSLEALGFQESTLKIECQGTNFSCADLPQFEPIDVNRLVSFSCPPRILSCPTHILGDLVLQSVYLNNITEAFEDIDVNEFDFDEVTRFSLTITDDDLVINKDAIILWESLEHAHIKGGRFELSTSDTTDISYLLELILESTVSRIPDLAFTWLINLNFLEIRGTAVGAGDIDIPQKAFGGLRTLKQLHLDNARIKSIEVGTFKYTPHLEDLKLIDNPLEAIPNGLLKGTSLNKINLQCGGNEINLGTHAFSKIVALQQVTISGCSFNLTEYLFSGSNNINHISIKDNIINDLPANIFSHLTKMKALYLDKNVIQELPNKVFDNLTSLRFLGLAKNDIQELHENVFSDLISLTELHLQDNRIHDLPSGIFDKMTSLTVLRLEHNELTMVHKGLFDAIVSLKTLDLSDNKIIELPKGIFDTMPSLEFLDLMNNNIQNIDNMFVKLTKLKTLHLNNNRIGYILEDTFSKLTSLENLTLHNNEHMWVTELDLQELRSLKYFDMSNVSLLDIPISMFASMRNLTHLFMKNNDIFKIDAIRPDPEIDAMSPFQNLKKLVTLDLSCNELQHLYGSWQNDLKQVKELNLARNSFMNIKDFQGDFSDMNITIDLRYNNISEVVLTPRVSHSNDTPSATSFLILNNNPILCDCNIYGLFLRSKGARLPHEPQYDLSATVCDAPPNLKGHLLKDVPPEELVCDLSIHLPVNCSSYTAVAATNEVILSCTEMPSTWIDLKINNFPYIFFEEPTITLNLEKQPENIEHLGIHKLNLSKANIDKIDFAPANTLKVLDLSHNNLVSVPDMFLNANIVLYLAGNPLNCDCQLIRKLKNMTTLSDAAFVTCVNEGKLTDIDTNEFCGRLRAMTSVIGVSAVYGAFAIMIIIPVCKYIKRNRQNIKRTLAFSHRRISETIHLTEVETDKKEYDIFISFTYQDEEFVRENLALELQYELKQKVCVHYRNWNDQDLFPEQIIEAVDNSTKTIIILTESYLTSEFTYMAFSRAHFLSKQDGMSRILIILLNSDITQNPRLNDDLKSYMATNCCLVWGDPNFWTQIKDILGIKP